MAMAKSLIYRSFPTKPPSIGVSHGIPMHSPLPCLITPPVKMGKLIASFKAGKTLELVEAVPELPGTKHVPMGLGSAQGVHATVACNRFS